MGKYIVNITYTVEVEGEDITDEQTAIRRAEEDMIAYDQWNWVTDESAEEVKEE